MKENFQTDIFFALLRRAAGLGEELPRAGCSPEWLFDMAHKQGVSALIFDSAVEYFGESIPDGTALPWLSLKKKVENWGLRQREAISTLSSLLGKEGVKVMLLKGCSTSLLYPNPLLRECGDIDIYCFDDYAKVNSLATAGGCPIIEEDEKHSMFHFHGIPVENHRKLNYEELNRTNRVIAKYMTSLIEEDTVTSEALPGVVLPGATARAFHLMMHTLTHLAWSGIPARNLVDWVLMVKRFGSDIDWKRLHAIWDEARLLRAIALVNRVCTAHLGMRSGWMDPVMDEDIERYGCNSDTDFLLRNILHPQESSADTSNPLRKIWIRIKRYLYRCRMHRIVYDERFPDGPLKGLTGKGIMDYIKGK